MLVAKGRDTHVPYEMAHPEVVRVLYGKPKGVLLNVEERSIFALSLRHLAKTANQVSVVAHHVMEADQLQEVASRKHHEVSGRKDIGGNPLNRNDWVNQLQPEVQEDQRFRLNRNYIEDSLTTNEGAPRPASFSIPKLIVVNTVSRIHAIRVW